MHTNAAFTAVFVLAATPVFAQSITTSVVTGTPLITQAQDTSLPFTQQTLAAGLDVSGGVFLSAVVPGGHSQASTQVAMTPIPPQLRVQERAVSAPLVDIFGTASTGAHDLVFTLQAVREFSGDIAVQWNGILQTIGDGALSARVDIGDDGTFEFSEVDGVAKTVRFPVAFGPGNPLVIRTRTTAQAFATANSTFDGLLTVEFEPDADSIAPGSFTPFGFGCIGSNFQSPLLIASPSGPILGQTFVAEVRNVAPAATSAIGMIALATVPPIHLDVIGMPFCFLALPPRAIVPKLLVPPFVGGTVVWSLQIPNETRLLGTHFYEQALIIDLPANPLGAVLSNPADCVIGATW